MKTILMQHFGGTTKSFMVFVKKRPINLAFLVAAVVVGWLALEKAQLFHP